MYEKQITASDENITMSESHQKIVFCIRVHLFNQSATKTNGGVVDPICVSRPKTSG
jgi:hypothetical protein